VNDEIAYLELHQVAELIRARQLSSVEVTSALLDRIDALDGGLQSYATVMREQALLAASQADEDLSRGRYHGELHGVPLALKDLCYTVDAPTSGGMTIHQDFQPDFDATVVSRFRAAGAVLIGKLRMTEGAFTEHHPDLPVPVNPWDDATWSGVSSSGSGVATAAGLCFGSIGSDTGGSIRLPSSMNGVTGLKPTWGRVSRHGTFELAASLDHLGPMARSARDCAAMLQVMAGADVNDPTASLEPVPNYDPTRPLPAPPRIGVDWTAMAMFDAETRQMLVEVVNTIEKLGWPVVEVRLPDLRSISDSFGTLLAVETAVAHAATYPSRASEYGATMQENIELGRRTSAVDYQHLVKKRLEFTGRFAHVMQSIDILLMPGVGFASPTIDKLSALGEDPDLFAALLMPTAPFDLTGSPSLTMPAGMTSRGTPLGVQFIGDHFTEDLLLQAAHIYQQATGHHQLHPQQLTHRASEGALA